MRMRDATKAEDMVQETFLAALKGGKSFAGKSAEKTWLVGIMKNKIADYYRKASRETSFSDLQFFHDEETDEFVSNGPAKVTGLRTAGRPSGKIPAQASIRSRFGVSFTTVPASCRRTSARCSVERDRRNRQQGDLPPTPNLRKQSLGHAASARMALRRCLETNWFGKMKAGVAAWIREGKNQGSSCAR